MKTIRNIAVLEPGYADYRQEEEILSRFGVRIIPVATDEQAAPALAKLNPVAILVRERKVGTAEMGACPDLRIVVRYGVGVDNVDLNEAAKRHIHVANIPDYGAEIEVSEHALALYLAVQRRIAERDQDIREGRWGIGQAAPIPARDRSVLGLNGCGKIGLATAQKFRALGFPRVIAFDPFLDPDQARQAQVERVDLDTLCAHADVVSLHTPLTPETHHILSAARIVADYDGVVCVPREYAEAVLEMAREIDDREAEQAKLIIASGSLKEGLAKYGRI